MGKKVKSIQKKMCEIFYKFKVFQLQISNWWSHYKAIKGVIKVLMGKKIDKFKLNFVNFFKSLSYFKIKLKTVKEIMKRPTALLMP